MYVIIGASGFLGTYLIKNILKSTDEQVLAVARHPLPSVGDQERVKWAACDIADPDRAEEFCQETLNVRKKCGGGYLTR